MRATDVVREAMRQSPGLSWGVWWNVGLLALSLAAMPFDERKILGLNPWVKPVKFDVSVILFLATMAVLLWALGDGWETSKAWIGWGIGVAMIVEDSVIALQSLRGVRSHMNYATPVDGGLFGVMGVAILVSSVLSLWVLVLWCRTDGGSPPVVVWGIRMGLVMLLVASVEGVRMVAHGGHTVGAEDGGAGLAFVNWSTGHGDLRVAHFFALHCLQIFPLVGLALARTPVRSWVQVSGLFGFAAGVWMGGLVDVCGGDARGAGVRAMSREESKNKCKNKQQQRQEIIVAASPSLRPSAERCFLCGVVRHEAEASGYSKSKRKSRPLRETAIGKRQHQVRCEVRV